MAHNRSRGRRFGKTGETTWLTAGTVAATVAASVKTQIATLNAGGLALRPFTVMRTRLTCMFESDQTATSERLHGAFGGIVVSDVASALGITGIPGPISDATSPWVFYQGMLQSFLFADSTGFIANGGQQYEIDSKAMRKVGTNEDLNFVFEMAAAKGGVLTVEGRMLVKLA